VIRHALPIQHRSPTCLSSRSLRNPILPYLFDDPALETEIFAFAKGLDRRHMNVLGHEMLADFTTHWMKEQICKVMSRMPRCRSCFALFGIVVLTVEQDAPQMEDRAAPSWWTGRIDLSEVPRVSPTS